MSYIKTTFTYIKVSKIIGCNLGLQKDSLNLQWHLDSKEREVYAGHHEGEKWELNLMKVCV